MKKFDEINIIPFVDIMLVLLAIVLITASFISQGKIAVNVPKSDEAVALTSDELAKLLTVTENGDWYLNDHPINKEQLNKEISTWQKNQKVTLKVDAKTDFENFVSITDLLAKQNIKNIAIVASTQKSK